MTECMANRYLCGNPVFVTHTPPSPPPSPSCHPPSSPPSPQKKVGTWVDCSMYSMRSVMLGCSRSGMLISTATSPVHTALRTAGEGSCASANRAVRNLRQWEWRGVEVGVGLGRRGAQRLGKGWGGVGASPPGFPGGVRCVRWSGVGREGRSANKHPCQRAALLRHPAAALPTHPKALPARLSPLPSLFAPVHVVEQRPRHDVDQQVSHPHRQCPDLRCRAAKLPGGRGGGFEKGGHAFVLTKHERQACQTAACQLPRGPPLNQKAQLMMATHTRT